MNTADTTTKIQYERRVTHPNGTVEDVATPFFKHLTPGDVRMTFADGAIPLWREIVCEQWRPMDGDIQPGDEFACRVTWPPVDYEEVEKSPTLNLAQIAARHAKPGQVREVVTRHVTYGDWHAIEEGDGQ